MRPLVHDNGGSLLSIVKFTWQRPREIVLHQGARRQLGERVARQDIADVGRARLSQVRRDQLSVASERARRVCTWPAYFDAGTENASKRENSNSAGDTDGC